MITYWKTIKYIFFLCILALIILIYKEDLKYKNKIYPNVYINNIYFGGKEKKDIINYFLKENQKLKNILLIIKFKEEPIATISASQINLHYDLNGIAERAFFIGRSTNLKSKYYQKITTLIFNKKFNLEVGPNYDKQKINELLLNFEESYNKPAKNALFKFENNRVIAFQKEIYGEKIQTNLFINQLEKNFYELKNKKTYPKNIYLNLQTSLIEPEFSLAKINNYGIEELIGVGQSDFSHSIPERIHNIKLASSKLNGIIIAKNKVFSFNENIGDISYLTGYKPAYIIKDGKTILGDGGGVCQVSTTLFRAALKAGLKIIERHPHAYRVSYYENDSPPGFDASVYSPTVDLKIKNTTPASILIQTEIDEANNLLYFKLYGKKDSRIVEISKPIIWDVFPPLEPLYQDDPTLKKGIVKQIDFPSWSAKVKFKYKVTLNNNNLEDEEIFSYYKPWRAIYLVGTADY